MRYLFGLLALVPLVLVALLNAYHWLAGRGFEPTADNLISYVVLLVVLLPAALVVGIRYRLMRARTSTFPDSFIYGGTAALGSGALLTVADYADEYFTPGGVGLAWPLAGLIVGSAYGLLFCLALRMSTVLRRSN
ncbi:hypothetical protein [Aureimonas sp. SK2]|uniref:hypothetical protein n=1 Tax=Aureimonas sp. SK2 TaxID=3015992 RepID=UPI0024444651|nr:hypothetical protein [Aureimonas sp. SK2]